MPASMYLTVFAISLAAWLLFEVWIFLRERGSQKDRASGGPARRQIAVLALAVAFAMNAPGLAPMLDVHANYAWFFWTGIALVWIGLLFRLWSVRTLGRFFTPQLMIQQGHGLITSGPYRFLRNPIYTAGLIVLSGLGIALGNGLSLALLVIAALIVYVGRIRSEARMLQLAFGPQYEDYKKKTWALIPFVW